MSVFTEMSTKVLSSKSRERSAPSQRSAKTSNARSANRSLPTKKSASTKEPDNPCDTSRRPAQQVQQRQGAKVKSTQNGAATHTSRTKTIPQSEVQEIHCTVSKPRNDAERRASATEVFNSTLKCLTSAAKARQESKLPDNRNGKAQSAEQRDNSINLIAERAVAAMRTLRTLEAQTANREVGSDNMLDKGTMILIEKLISLGFVSLAQSELSTFYVRHWKRPQPTPDPNDTTPEHLEVVNQLVLQMLVEPKHLSQSDFGLATTYQSQVLRSAIHIGSQVIDQRFVDCIAMSSIGGPAHLILHGLKAGFLTQDKAGDQLRICAQALLKLYSIAILDKQNGPERLMLNFNLLIEALTIKAESWRLISHKADIGREYWGPILKGLKRLEGNWSPLNRSQISAVTGFVKFACHSLKRSEFDGAVPLDIVNAVVDIHEKAECYSDAVTVIQESLKDFVRPSSIAKMLLTWRLTNLQYKESPLRNQRLLDVLTDALLMAKVTPESLLEKVEVFLLHGARLRKTITAVFQDISRCPDEMSIQSVDFGLLEYCIQILRHLSEIIYKLLLLPCPDQSLDVRKSEFTSFAKVFEAIIEFSKRSATDWPLLQSKCDAVLENSIQASKDILQSQHAGSHCQQIISFTETLHVRVSQMYWLRYANEQNRSSITTENLDRSCTILQGLSSSAQHVGKYGMKLEKLALAHLAAKRYELACKGFENAIKHYVELGGLTEATSAALSGPRRNVWSRSGTASYSLGKALLSLAKLRLTYELKHTTTDSWIYDDPTLNPVERSLLFDAQLASVGDHNFTQEQAENFETRFHESMNSLSDTTLHVYRSRFLSAVLHTISKSSSLSSQITIEQGVCRSELQTPRTDRDHIHLLNYADSIYHLAQLQINMQQRPVNTTMLKANIEAISQFLSGLPASAVIQEWIDDVDILTKQMQAVVDFAQTVYLVDLAMSTLLSLKKLLELANSCNTSQYLDILSQLGRLYQHLGKSTQASKMFSIANQVSSQCSHDHITNESWKLIYVQHLLDLGDIPQAAGVFEQYVTTLRSCQPHQQCSARDRFDRDVLVCKTSQVASQIALQSGNLKIASQFARQAVKLSTQIWSIIEKSKGKEEDSDEKDDSTITQLNLDLTNLSLSHHAVPASSKLRGSAYWKFTDLHLSTLYQTIIVSMHSGLYTDIKHYTEQLCRISSATGSNAHQSRASALLGLIYASAQDHASAIKHLDIAENIAGRIDNIDDQLAVLWLAEGFIEVGDISKATALLHRMHLHLEQVDTLTQVKPNNETGIHKAPVRGRTKSSRPIKEPPKRPGVVQSERGSASSSLRECKSTSQQSIRAKFEALKNQIALLNSGAASLPSTMLNSDHASKNTAHLLVTRAMLMFRQALSELSSDAVKCVLAETAVALPVRYRSSRKSGRVSFIQATGPPVAGKPIRNGRTKAANANAAIQNLPMSAGESLIAEAQKLLLGISKHQGVTCTTDVVHMVHKLQSRLCLISSTMNIPFTMTSPELVLQSLMPKDIAQDRERMAIAAEQATRDKAQVLEWPDLALLKHHVATEDIFDCSLDDLSDIPETWTIITISLADDQRELLLSKIERTQSPFLLRVPLSRAEMEMSDESEFLFADAKAELLDIIAEANASAHDTRGQGNRDMRKAWYAEREELDQRLENWLVNVESIWLGGFRGLLSARRFEDVLLVKFGQLLSQTLDKHLPSRQKMGSQTSSKIVLHAHVLELFLGLGHPDQKELDDAATDLLYFVIDILQFSGEHNAYDEIDFDAMLVDVFDAMRACHETNQHDGVDPSRHTILIVDKEMGSFPWESLPCLRNQSVSRMPSLSSVFQRLKKIREQSSMAQAFSIPADTGAYILNPSMDLTSTQTTFEPILHSQLSNFTSTVNKPPSEAEFASALTSNELLLYFGHGSGAQYIRGRTIRNLDRCAVTLLMGCSSAKMTECGKFESYGMPGYYIGGLSGCMSVVGTLWDVTDRDIDRFALKTMVEWGLMEDDELVTKALEKKNKKVGRGRRHDQEGELTAQDRRGVVALDEAVQRGRDACLLRYLNGAAPVVYGIPVVLR